MQTTSNVLTDIDINAIIARAMAEVGISTSDNTVENTVEIPSNSSTVEETPWLNVTSVASPIIPERDNTVVVNESTSRFSGAIWYQEIQKQEVTLAGVGGIGSYIAFLLGRLNIQSLVIYDDDIVEAANMSGQLYGRDDIRLSKASAITKFILRYTDLRRITGFTERYTEACPGSPIMICGFDNMEARRTFFNNWKAYVDNESDENKAKCLFLDGRLSAEEFQIFCIKGDDTRAIGNYNNNYLFTDDEADATICSYKQTSFMANMIGSVMVNLFVNFIANQCGPLIPRDVPFYTEYNAQTMFFKVIA